MAQPENSEPLPVLFDRGVDLHEAVQNYEGRHDKPVYLEKVQAAVDCFVGATHLVNAVALFSRNEELDEVHTEHLKYLLLPAFLADLSYRSGLDNRLEKVQAAQVYATDYLTRCKDYAVTEEVSDREGSSAASLAVSGPLATGAQAQAARERQLRVEKYKRRKQAEERLKTLKEKVDAGIQDEEVKRDYNISLLRMWVCNCEDQLQTISEELKMLEYREKLLQESASAPSAEPDKDRPPKKTFKPVVITREKIKAGVFGAGYPSLPTVTLEEFYDKECQPIVQQYHEQQAAKHANDERRRRLGEDPLGDGKLSSDDDEDDDEEKLKKARAKDDWKDDHRRGWGNRMNQG